MDCRDFSENLQAYIDNELSEMEHNSVEAHLKDCAPCMEELRELLKVNDILNKAFLDKPPVAGMMARVIAAISGNAPPAEKPQEDAPDVEKDPSTGLAGRTLGGYEVIEKIGSGGMGTVYKASQLSMSRDVALKVLYHRYSEDETFVQRFIREARSAGVLNHGNIVRMYDVGQADGFHYMSMEFVQGRSVFQLLGDKDRLEPERALDIIIETARALDHAHRKSIIHRDIKPENIIVNTDGHVKVADLGLAKQIGMSQDASMTVEGQVMGTPQYMSPEQVVDSSKVDHRTDIYSLGATFYFMLTGERPFEGKTAMEAMVAVMHDELAFSREQQEFVPRQLVKVVEKMTEKDPAKRYQTAAEMVDELEHIRNRPFTYASAPSAPKPRAVRAVAARRDREPVSAREKNTSSLVWLAALAAGVLLLLGLWAALGPDSSEKINDNKIAVNDSNKDRHGPPKQVQLPPQERVEPPPPKPKINTKAKEEWEAVVKMMAEHPEDYAGLLSRAEAIIQGYPSSPYAENAQNLMSSITEKLEKLLADAKQKSDAMKRSSDYNGAVAMWEGFEQQYAGTDTANLGGSYRRQLIAEQHSKFKRDMGVAGQKLKTGDSDGAMYEYEKVAKYGNEEMKRDATARIASIESAIKNKEEDKKRQQRFALLDEFYRTTLGYMMSGQYVKAIDATDLASSGPNAELIKEFISLEQTDVLHLIDLDKALKVAFSKMTNSTVDACIKLRGYDRAIIGKVEEMSPGIFILKPSDKKIAPLISLDMKKLEPDEIVKLTESYLPDKEGMQMKHYLLYLYEGDLDKALAVLDKLSGRKREAIEKKQASESTEKDVAKVAGDASKKLQELMKKYGGDAEKLGKELEKLAEETAKAGKIPEGAEVVEQIVEPGNPKYAICYEKYNTVKPIIIELTMEDAVKKLYDSGKLAYRKRDYEDAQDYFERLLGQEYAKAMFLDEAKREEIAKLLKNIEGKQGKTLTAKELEKDEIASLFNAAKVEKLKSGKYRVTYDFTAAEQLKDFLIRRDFIKDERIEELFAWSSRKNVEYREAPNWAIVKYQKYFMLNGKGERTFTWKGIIKGDATIEFSAIPLGRDNIIALLDYSEEGTYVLATSYRGGNAEWHREHFGLTRTVLFRRYWDDDPRIRLLNGGWQVIGNAGKTLVQANTAYTVKAMKKDNKLTLYINGQRYAEGKDNTWSGGRPGVWTQESHVLFTNIKITGELDKKWIEEELKRLGKKEKAEEKKKDKDDFAKRKEELYKGATETTRRLIDEVSKINGVTIEDLERVKKLSELSQNTGGEWGKRGVERFTDEVKRIESADELRKRLDEWEKMIERFGNPRNPGGGWTPPGGGRPGGGRGGRGR